MADMSENNIHTSGLQSVRSGWVARVTRSRWFATVVWTLRVLIGSLFVMSGLVKGIDLWGFIFKIEDYLAVWGFTEPRSLVLMGVLLISGYEFVFGFMLATGCYKRVAVWALTAMMAVMLPLSAYIAIANPVSDCGCFGDFWIISNTWTFIKNILISAALIFLLIFNRRLRVGMYQPAIQWIVGAWISLYFIIVALYGYNVQPMADFRPYPVGAYLVENNDDEDSAGDVEAEEADEDVSEDDMTFIYERDGEQREFTIDDLPDSTWTFVERVESDTQSANGGKAEGADFVVYDADGEDVTYEAITGAGTELLLVIPEPRRIDISYTYFLNELKQWADTSDVRMTCLIASDRRGIAYWKDVSMAAYDVFSAEDTKLKELSRGTMSLVELKDGRVVAKYTLSSIDGDILDEGPSGKDLLSRMAPMPKAWFKALTGFFGVALLLLYIFQSLVLAVSARIRGFYQKKAVNLQAKSKDAAAGPDREAES